MGATRYAFAKDAGPEDWRALPKRFRQGERVTRFTGHTYGLDRDDAMYLGCETIACCMDGNAAFFTVPVDLLVDEDGKHPRGDYWLPEKSSS